MTSEKRILVSIFGILLCGFSFARTARACGASAGSGGVAVCSVKEGREKERKKWHVSSSYSFTSTKLVFSGDALEQDETVEQERHIALIAAEWRVSPELSFQGGVGGLLAGQISSESLLGAEEPSVAMTPGLVAVLGSSYVVLRSKGAVPFVLITGQLSGVFSGTEAQTGAAGEYRAFDLRLGTSVGWTLWNKLSPYAVVRMFGGPADWEQAGQTIRGTDRYHYQVGGGLSLLLDYRFDLFVEGVPLGEKGLVGGVGLAF